MASGPTLHDHLQEKNREVLSKYDIMTLSEGAGTTKSTAMSLVDPERKELDMSYHFEGVSLGYLPGEFKQMDPNGYKLTEFKKIYSEWDSVFADKGWGTVYLGNHDQPRMLTRWGNDAPGFRDAASKMLTTFLLSMRGTPFYYFGDELGMSNIKFDKIEDYRDIESISMYHQLKNQGADLQRFLNGQKISARDNGRTPFQWDSTANAGFTTGTPWIKINNNKASVNVSSQEKDPNSPLNYFREMVKLRKDYKDVLVYGKYTLLDAANPDVYAYTREGNGQRFLVLLSFSKSGGSFNLGAMQLGEELINNLQALKVDGSVVSLQPYQACVVQLK